MNSFREMFGADDSVPSVKQPLLGFRKWRADFENNLLLSHNEGIPWQPGVNYASGCNHPSPGEGCHCGFNGWYDEGQNDFSHYSGVTGAFAGAGDIRLHKMGFRSSEAQILALLVSKTEKKKFAKLSARYRIPVFTSKKKFIKFVSRFAAPLDSVKGALVEAEDILRTKAIKRKQKRTYGLMSKISKTSYISDNLKETIFWVVVAVAVFSFGGLGSQVVYSVFGTIPPGVAGLILFGVFMGAVWFAANIFSGFPIRIRDSFRTVALTACMGMLAIFSIFFNAAASNVEYTMDNAEGSMSKIAWAQEAYYQEHGHYSGDLQDFSLESIEDIDVMPYDKEFEFTPDTQGNHFFLKIDSDNPQEYALFYNSGKGTGTDEEGGHLAVIGNPGTIKANCSNSKTCESNSWTPELTSEEMNDVIGGEEDSIYSGMSGDWDKNGLAACLPSGDKNLFETAGGQGQFEIITDC